MDFIISWRIINGMTGIKHCIVSDIHSPLSIIIKHLYLIFFSQKYKYLRLEMRMYWARNTTREDTGIRMILGWRKFIYFMDKNV